jgi:hypothetical protein
MKSLFSFPNENFSKDALDIDTSVSDFISNLMDEYLDKGYSTREIEYVCLQAINMVSAEKRIIKGIKIRKSKNHRN